MLKVALTGGLCSGKSTVAEMLAGHGCFLLNADHIGHELILPDGAGYAPVVAEFGGGILNVGGRIDRARLGAIVFADRERLIRLNRILHPLIIAEAERRLEEWQRGQPGAIAVVEAALFVEEGLYHSFDRLLVVTCAREQKIERFLQRNAAGRSPLTEAERAAFSADANRRLAAQLPDEEKVRCADDVIDNSGTLQATAEQAERVYRKWREFAA